MSTDLILIISCTFVVSVFIVAFLALKTVIERNRRIARRVAGVDGGGEAVQRPNLAKKPKEMLDTLSSNVSLPDSDEITRIRFQLAQAGFFGSRDAQKFYAIRLISLLVPQFFLLLFWQVLLSKVGLSNALIIASAAIIIGLMAPVYALRGRIARRRDQCRDGFPDMIDLLVASIEAGLSLDMAFSRIAADIGSRYPVLKVNLDIMNLELRAGKGRHEAMMNFAQRIDLEDAKALCVMLKQSEDMGSSMGRALRTFSEDMREKRMLLAEEKAMALSAKMTVPLILFIFPTLMVMLMVPAAIRLMDALG